ncbi:MAG: N-acetylmuramoyl-L-alanine amidase [Bacteroidaceae bacterium]|nr:N-acetylmuramoyl-L-alanine amidase [Bacteroidaceae bacterium]
MIKKTIHTILVLCLALALPLTAMGQNDKFIVVLDAGHGGHDAGAVGRPTTNREKDINLAITLKVGQLLKKNCPDVQVLYTRDTDVFVTLDGRANIANKAKANLFVSIHTNAIERSPSRQPVGVQSYTLSLKTVGTNLEVEKRENSVIQFEADGEQKYSFANPNSSESDIIFELMQDQDMQESVNFAKLAQEEMVRSGGRNDMGVLQANLAVLRLTYMPSVLLEVGFISTPAEETFLMSDEGRTVMAQCIYNAISRYKTQHTGRMSNLEKIDTKAANKIVEEREAERLKQEAAQAEADAKKAEDERKADEARAAQAAEAQAKAQEAREIAERDNAEAKQATANRKAAEAQLKQADDALKKAENELKLAQAATQNPALLSKIPTSSNSKTTQPTAGIVFKVQLFASQREIKKGSAEMKGLDADSFKEGDLYKYTYGATTDYNEILRIKKEIASKFPDTFIVAFKDGVKMNTNEAIKQWRAK